MSIDALNLKGSSVTVNKDIQPRPKSATDSVSEPESVLSNKQAVTPVQSVQQVNESQNVTQDALNQAIELVQEQVQSISRDLLFNVDEDSGKTVIKVLDTETGETIRQIPSEEFLEISRALSEVVDELSESLPSVLLDEEV